MSRSEERAANVLFLNLDLYFNLNEYLILQNYLGLISLKNSLNFRWYFLRSKRNERRLHENRNICNEIRVEIRVYSIEIKTNRKLKDIVSRIKLPRQNLRKSLVKSLVTLRKREQLVYVVVGSLDCALLLRLLHTFLSKSSRTTFLVKAGSRTQNVRDQINRQVHREKIVRKEAFHVGLYDLFTRIALDAMQTRPSWQASTKLRTLTPG